MLEVEFHVYLPDGTVMPASRLLSDDQAIAALVEDFDGTEGYLAIRDGDGQETTFADVLSILIPTFCLGGLADLLEDGRMRVDFFNHPETATLTVADGTLTLAGDQIKTTTLPLDAYVTAQRACGAVYLDLARRVCGDDLSRSSTLSRLAPIDG